MIEVSDDNLIFSSSLDINIMLIERLEKFMVLLSPSEVVVLEEFYFNHAVFPVGYRYCYYH